MYAKPPGALMPIDRLLYLVFPACPPRGDSGEVLVEQKKSPVFVCPSYANLLCLHTSGRMRPELLLWRPGSSPQRDPQPRIDCGPEPRRLDQGHARDRRCL